MRYLTFFLIYISFNLAANNDNPDDIITLLKENKIEEAKKLSDKLIETPKHKEDAKTWFYRAVVYHNIYETNNKQINNLDKNSLLKTYESYSNTLKFDKDKNFSNDALKGISIVSNQFVYEGINHFNNHNFVEALFCFEKNLEIGRLPAINQIDTIILYNAAISAENSGNIKLAAEYYNELAKMQFGEAQIYLDLIKALRMSGQDERYENTLHIGIRSYPNDAEGLYIDAINYYLEKENYPETLKYIELALKTDNTNSGLHFIKASINEGYGKIEEAEAGYLKTIEIDENHIDALFNIATIYYNKGVDILKVALSREDKARADIYYKKAIPYFERVNKLTPDNEQTISILNNLYDYFQMDEKKKILNKK